MLRFVPNDNLAKLTLQAKQSREIRSQPLSKPATPARRTIRMGRPPGSVESLRRNRVVTMVTDSELKRLTTIAEVENQSLSATVHKLLARSLDAKE